MRVGKLDTDKFKPKDVSVDREKSPVKKVGKIKADNMFSNSDGVADKVVKDRPTVGKLKVNVS